MTQKSAQDLLSYLQHTPMAYAYKALLALMIAMSETRVVSLDEVVDFFYRFYQVRQQSGLRLERSTRQPELIRAKFRAAVNTPYTLFHDQGFLEREGDRLRLCLHLSISQRQRLYHIALDRLAAHYQEPREQIAALVQKAVPDHLLNQHEAVSGRQSLAQANAINSLPKSHHSSLEEPS